MGIHRDRRWEVRSVSRRPCVILLWAVRRPAQAVTMNFEACALACVCEDVRVNLAMSFPGRWVNTYYSQPFPEDSTKFT